LKRELTPRDPAWYRSVVESLPHYIFVGEPGGLLSFVDPRIYPLLGLDPSAEAGIGWLERIHEADRRVAYAHPAVFHARAHVEQQQRGDWLAVSGEDRDVRGLAVVEHLEVLLAEIGDEPALRS